jgi:RimJ/RimL family protein N-acetyltransferase
VILIETERLILRNGGEQDRRAFHRLNSDEGVMKFFPFRRSRAEADAVMDTLAADNDSREFGFGAVELKGTGETVGMAGLKPTRDVPTRQPAAVEIGWRLLPEHWRLGYATEAAQGFLAFGFATLRLDEIVSFAVWNNTASIAVMLRLGMTRVADGDFAHPSVSDHRPDLKTHVLYALSGAGWRRAGRRS